MTCPMISFIKHNIVAYDPASEEIGSAISATPPIHSPFPLEELRIAFAQLRGTAPGNIEVTEAITRVHTLLGAFPSTLEEIRSIVKGSSSYAAQYLNYRISIMTHRKNLTEWQREQDNKLDEQMTTLLNNLVSKAMSKDVIRIAHQDRLYFDRDHPDRARSDFDGDLENATAVADFVTLAIARRRLGFKGELNTAISDLDMLAILDTDILGQAPINDVTINATTLIRNQFCPLWCIFFNDLYSSAVYACNRADEIVNAAISSGHTPHRNSDIVVNFTIRQAAKEAAEKAADDERNDYTTLVNTTRDAVFNLIRPVSAKAVSADPKLVVLEELGHAVTILPTALQTLVVQYVRDDFIDAIADIYAYGAWKHRKIKIAQQRGMDYQELLYRQQTAQQGEMDYQELYRQLKMIPKV